MSGSVRKAAMRAERRESDDGSFRRLRDAGRSHRRAPVLLAHPGWITVGASVALALLGIYCIDLTAGVNARGASAASMKQLAFLGVAILAGAVAATPHYRWIARLTPLLAIGTLAALAFVLTPGVPDWLVTPRNGARRWINLGVTDFQPSEIAKIAYVLAVARYLRYRKNHRRFFGLAGPAVITFVPMGLILVEPDLGTALLFLPALFAMLIAAGAKLKHLVFVVVVALATAPAMYPLLEPHQKVRIQAMYNQIVGDTSKNDSINYQGDRAMTLIGAGGVAGLGASKSRAIVDFNELPEDHNDMIFAVIANRFGLAGGVGVLGLYFCWIFGAAWTAAACKDPVGRLVAVGLAAMIATQMTINIGMNVGLMPITGMTLPFVSAGGSSLVTSFLMVGLIFNIAMRRPQILARRSFEFDGEDDDE